MRKWRLGRLLIVTLAVLLIEVFCDWLSYSVPHVGGRTLSLKSGALVVEWKRLHPVDIDTLYEENYSPSRYNIRPYLRTVTMVTPANGSLLIEQRTRMMIPFSLLFVLTAVVAGVLIVPRLFRKKSHSCGQCGYSLIGNVSGICPECGTAIVSSNSAA